MRDRTQVNRITGQLMGGHLGVDDGVAGQIRSRFGAVHLAAATPQISKHSSNRVLGNRDLHLVDRLQERNGRLIRCLPKGHGTCSLEGHIGGVNRMRLAIDQRHPQINQGVTSKYPLGQLTANALLY